MKSCIALRNTDCTLFFAEAISRDCGQIAKETGSFLSSLKWTNFLKTVLQHSMFGDHMCDLKCIGSVAFPTIQLILEGTDST